ncbi:MAG TPA: DinB family protein [Dongiaceae bacterium]|nr:DinB family protein [Dongiaceae bacterium]
MLESDVRLLDALLDSWQRSNVILTNLLRAVPEGGLDVRGTLDSPSVAQLFAHMHFVRLVFLAEDAPEFARPLTEEWVAEKDVPRLVDMLNESANAVAQAVRERVETSRPMNMHYDHPILFLQHMIWHEGYHHGQIKLALKGAGLPMNDEAAGPLTWSVWMKKS